MIDRAVVAATLRLTIKRVYGRTAAGMSSATVLDSIIEGVRADVAAREAVVPLAEIKQMAKDAPPSLDVMREISVLSAGLLLVVPMLGMRLT